MKTMKPAVLKLPQYPIQYVLHVLSSSYLLYIIIVIVCFWTRAGKRGFKPFCQWVLHCRPGVTFAVISFLITAQRGCLSIHVGPLLPLHHQQLWGMSCLQSVDHHYCWHSITDLDRKEGISRITCFPLLYHFHFVCSHSVFLFFSDCLYL